MCERAVLLPEIFRGFYVSKGLVLVHSGLFFKVI